MNILGGMQETLCDCFFFLGPFHLCFLVLICFTVTLQSRDPNELKSSKFKRFLNTSIFSFHSNHY